MYAGLRRGELMALRVEDVDLAAGVIRVCRGWDAVEGVIRTKNSKDRRVPIASVLRAHLAKQLLNARPPRGPRVRRVGVESVLALAAPRTGRDGMEGGWSRRSDVARVPAHVREPDDRRWRHAKALSTYMGHANISITLDRYGHLMPGNEDEAAGLLGSYLDRVTEHSPERNVSADVEWESDRTA